MLKKLSIFTGLLVILGIVAWFAQKNMTPAVEPAPNATILENLDTEQLSSIVIQSDADQQVELTKESDGQWKVKAINYEADSQKIQAFLLKLLDTPLAEKITDQPKHHARFHLVHVKENNGQWEKEKTGKLITLNGKEGTPLFEILLGKARNGKQGQYIRYANQPNVYLIIEDIPSDTETYEWVNASITNFDGDQWVKKMELQSDGDVFEFVREKEGDPWQAKGVLAKETVNPAAVQSLGNALNQLDFEKIIPAETPPAEAGREQLVDYTAELFDGRIVKLSMGAVPNKDEQYYMAIEMALKDGVDNEELKEQVKSFNERSQPWLYGLKSWVGERFLKNREDLIENKE